MKTKLITVIGVVVLGLSLLALSCAPSGQVKPADFYQGKNLDWTSCTPPGGSADSIARLLAQYMDQRMGTTAVMTVRRGAGGTEGPMYVYRAQPDGLTFGSWVLTAHVLQKIMAAPGSDYELDQYNYIASVDVSPQVFFVAANGPYQTVAALQAGKAMKMGATSLDGNFALGDMTVAYVMGLDAKVVTGYTGVAPVVLSMEQGETMGMLMPISTAYASVVAGRIKPLFVVGTKRSDLYPDVPALSEIVSASGDKKTLLEVWDGLGQSYHTFATPGIPADRVKYLQETAAAVMADPTFQSEIDKISGYHVTTYINGKDLGEAVAKVAKLGADAKSMFDMLTQRYAATQ